MTSFGVFIILIIYMLLISRGMITLDEKKSIYDKMPSLKLNECERCKLLTESFSTWLAKTSRGKHEGGDTAWEEAKLKSYARSEMRLVEIQESLCSEIKTHQDHCYSLAEETEQLLETWWFHDYFKTLNLYTWLCIENLQYCCPPYHFGEACTPCPLDINNKICAGNGKCEGDGTRTGNGACVCKKEYSGKNCDECSSNFYKIFNVCKPCHKSCHECHGDGPNVCVQCALGWSMEMGECVDIDECLEVSTCKASEFCTNRQGSYVCKSCDTTCNTCAGPGATDCTSCKENSILMFGKCICKDLVKNLVIRLSLYNCLLPLVVIIFWKSRYLLTFVVFIISFLLYVMKNTLNDVY